LVSHFAILGSAASGDGGEPKQARPVLKSSIHTLTPLEAGDCS
jgi:hypothetical protein